MGAVRVLSAHAESIRRSGPVGEGGCAAWGGKEEGDAGRAGLCFGEAGTVHGGLEALPFMSITPVIRRAAAADMPVVARFAGQLVRFHHALDPQRFLLVEPLEPGYGWWLSQELLNDKAVILVAEDPEKAGAEGGLLGYAYGRVEERDWNALLDACGALHDIYVAEEARGRGIGELLVEAIGRELAALGAPRMVLSTAVQNAAAQRLFRRLGFRDTMIEMTRELGKAPPAG